VDNERQHECLEEREDQGLQNAPPTQRPRVADERGAQAEKRGCGERRACRVEKIGDVLWQYAAEGEVPRAAQHHHEDKRVRYDAAYDAKHNARAGGLRALREAAARVRPVRRRRRLHRVGARLGRRQRRGGSHSARVSALYQQYAEWVENKQLRRRSEQQVWRECRIEHLHDGQAEGEVVRLGGKYREDARLLQTHTALCGHDAEESGEDEDSTLAQRNNQDEAKVNGAEVELRHRAKEQSRERDLPNKLADSRACTVAYEAHLFADVADKYERKRCPQRRHDSNRNCVLISLLRA
jgi:hypothetical protein